MFKLILTCFSVNNAVSKTIVASGEVMYLHADSWLFSEEENVVDIN